MEETVQEVEEGQVVEEWKEVTPEKASRSSKIKAQSLQFRQVQILTPSRYEVLSNSKEEEENSVQDKEKEVSDAVSDKEIEEDSSEDEESGK